MLENEGARKGGETVATLNRVTTAAKPRRRAATVAAILYCWFGFAFIVSSLLIANFMLRNGKLPVIFGITMLAGPFSEQFGARQLLATIGLWSVVNVLEMLVGFWLWKSRKAGGKLGVALFPLGAIFWISYALPIMALVGPLRVLLIAWGWKSLR